MRGYLEEMLNQCLYIAILAAMVSAVVLSIVYCVYRFATGGRKAFPGEKAFVLFLLVCYLAALWSAAVLQEPVSDAPHWNFQLFAAWRLAWSSFYRYAWAPILLRLVMYLPLGVILPFLAKPFRKWYAVLGTGFGLSLAAETTQYLTRRGTADVDDLLANTLGVMVGFCLVMLVCSGRWEDTRNRKKAPFAPLPLAFAALFVWAFAGYYVQEFGCLNDAVILPANVGGTVWTADCLLSSDRQTVPVYHREPLDQASGMEFAAAFAGQFDITFQDADYDDDRAIFQNHSTGDFLTLYYSDGSYNYTVGGSLGGKAGEMDETALRALLEQHGITVPDSAQFSGSESSGRHTFTVDMELDGNLLLDGALSCLYASDGTLAHILNHLVCYEFYREAKIISQAEAYEQLCAGNFLSAHWFEYALQYSGASSVTVTSCVLDYQADSKGFYQPVYVFTLEADNGHSFDAAVVPALIK